MRKSSKAILVIASAVLIVALLILSLQSRSVPRQEVSKETETVSQAVVSPAPAGTPRAAPSTQKQSSAARRIRLAAIRTDAPRDPNAPSTKPSDTAAPKPAKVLVIPGVDVAGEDILPVVTDRVKVAPPLERQRVAEKAKIDPAAAYISIASDFECASPLEVKKISPTHFSVKIVTDSKVKNWFMFRVDGAKGKTVRIDIQDANWSKWSSLNPVYSYVRSLDDPSAFTSKPAREGGSVAYNGPTLPDTSGQSWHYISNVWHEGNSFCFVQALDEDRAWIAMRPPYTPELNRAMLSQIASSELLSVYAIGRSDNGVPLNVLRVGTGDPTITPCIIMYAREHASEHDTSWGVWGAIEYVLRDDAEAEALRKKITFLFIPLLDPDGAAKSQYARITHDFVYGGSDRSESSLYARFFQKWLDRGNRLTLSINLHNMESAEADHLTVPLVCSGYETQSIALNLRLRTLLDKQQIRFDPVSQRKGTASSRMGGYLCKYYSTLMMPYELNSQEKHRHLTITETKSVGAAIIETASQFLETRDGISLIRVADQTLADRKKLLGSVLLDTGHSDPFAVEERVLAKGNTIAGQGKDEFEH